MAPAEQEMHEQHLDPQTGANEMEDDGNGAATMAPPARTRQSQTRIDPSDPSTWGKVPRNSQCPCGSGKKYKHCHGR
jgi:preprotein translocase subunit SecA